MKTMLAMATMAVAFSFEVSNIAAAQDREAHATRLFDVAERIQQTGPCSDLPFLWLTNPKMIAFLDSLLSGGYDNAGPMLPEYIACFEHQKAVAKIRAVIHADFPETEAALKVAEVGYFTESDIAEFIWLLEGTVIAETNNKSVAGLDGSDVARRSGYKSLSEIRTATGATAGLDSERKRDTGIDPQIAALGDIGTGRSAGVATPTDAEQGRTRGTGEQVGAFDESSSAKIPHHKPPAPSAPSEEAVVALLESLDREIRESAAPAPNGDGTARAFQRKKPLPGSPTPIALRKIPEESALAERARRFRERRGNARIGPRRLSFAPPLREINVRDSSGR